MRFRQSLFWLLVVSTAVLGGGQFLMIVASWSSTQANAWYWRPFALTTALVAVVFVVVGLLIARRRPDNPIGWMLAAVGASVLLYQAASEYALRGLVVAPGSLPAAGEAAVLSQTLWIIPFGLIPVVLLLYPTGRFLSRAWAIGVVLSGSAILLLVGPGTIVLWPFRESGSDLLFAESGIGVMDAFISPVIALVVAAVVLAAASIVVRWRRSSGVERQQIKWLLPSCLIILAQGALVIFDPDGGGLLGEVLLQTGLASIPVAIGVAVLRYRLYDIDLVINRTLVYGALTGLLGLVYVGSVVLLGGLLRPLAGSNDLAVAGSTLAVAALFSPARRRTQAFVDRRFYRSRYDAARTVEAFSARLRDEVDLDTLSSDLQTVVRETLQPASVSMWTREARQ